jgi:hypothetical protein
MKEKIFNIIKKSCKHLKDGKCSHPKMSYDRSEGKCVLYGCPIRLFEIGNIDCGYCQSKIVCKARQILIENKILQNFFDDSAHSNFAQLCRYFQKAIKK